MTPSNTDTELGEQVKQVLIDSTLSISVYEPGMRNLIVRVQEVQTNLLALIARRDTERMEALLKAVGELTVPMDDGTELLPTAAVIRHIESIYGGEK